MRKPILITLVISMAAFSLAGKEYTPADRAIIKALADELGRSITELKTDELPAPYFISYGVSDIRSVGLSASLGAIVNMAENPSRTLDVEVRVGDYDFDNSNFAGGIGRIGAMMESGGLEITSSLPLSDDYDLIRRGVWRATDRAFKDAHENLAGKQAALASAPDEKETADMTHEEPVEYSEPPLEWSPDAKAWKERLRHVSAAFARFEHIRDSEVTFGATFNREYIVNSEGTRIIENYALSNVILSASTQTEDGEIISDNRSFIAHSPSELPDEKALVEAVEELAQSLEGIAGADSGMYYIGPVLFEGQAASELWLRLIGNKVSVSDMPVLEDARMRMAFDMIKPEDLSDKLGKRITADFIDIYDDPTAEEFAGRKLIGGYRYDNEGVPAQRVNIIENGTLSAMLMHRRPFKDFDVSNGHARLGGAGLSSGPFISNLFVESTGGLPDSKLRDAFIEECKAQGLAEGYIVRGIYHPAGEKDMAENLMASMMPMMQGKKPGERITPLEVYRVDIETGEDVRVQGIEFNNLGTRSLRDIIALGDNPDVYNVTVSRTMRPVPVSVIAPDILFEEIEISIASSEKEKRPLLDNPLFAD